MTEILIESESPLWGPPDQWNKLVRRAAEAALEAAWPWGDAHRARAELSVFLTDDAGIRALNRQWRRKDSATNVLAFRMLEPSEAPTGLETVLLGDVVLSHETMAREADTFGISLSDHVAHLVVHG
ncbi:MAG: rRNA maturation RNase YbeY, partial [Thermaurantiacus sp.]